MAAEQVGGAFLSASLQVLFDRLSSEVVVDFVGNEKPVLMELRNCFMSAEAVLCDAEKKQIRDPHVKLWLKQLQDAIDEAEDLLDEIEYEALQRSVEAKTGSNTSKLLKLFPNSFAKAIKKAQIQNILDRLSAILGSQFALGLKQGVQKRPLFPRLIAPLAEESDVYGRDADKNSIMELLLSDATADQTISVIPIVGMGGIGKTTLAQLIFDDEIVKRHFDLNVWVTVSDNFDVSEITKAIYERATGQYCNTGDLRELQLQLITILKAKRFLFVLDDVWNHNYHLWDVLQSPFEFGADGSKIIVTTRSSLVASAMGNVPAYHLRSISDADCWQLFTKHAFKNRNTDSDAHPDLQLLGREIVKKCKGLPLAVKTLAKHLSLEQDPKNWENLLNSDIWQLELQENDILSTLWLSYYDLPSHLKPCFLYCSLFPKDYECRKDKIIKLWMAEGLLLPEKGKRLEDVAEDYLSDLISRSLLQESTSGQRFVMHDLMHDLAVSISNKLCVPFYDHELSYLEGKARHLTSIRCIDYTNNKSGTLSKAKSFRSFLTLSPSTDRIQKTLEDDEIFLSFGLRALSLSHTSRRKLPHSISNLKHLRYLDLSFTYLIELPNSVCDLYNLQTLLLSHCEELVRLPTNLARLIKLRHLDISGSISLNEMPPKMSNLKDLQTLTDFILGKHTGFDIQELGDLQHLHGGLKISGLENVVDVGHVLKAHLQDKRYLSLLRLEWYGDTDDSTKERGVLNGLQPHTNLRELEIDSFRGTRFPSWVGDPSFSNMVKVCLIDCKNCCFLPSLGQLPSLKELEIDGFDGVVTVGVEFYYDVYSAAKPFRSLEVLVFRKMTQWEDWLFIEIAEKGGVFPRVKDLYLEYCPKLKVNLPDCLPSLTTLKICECKQLMPLQPRAEQMDTAFPSLRTMVLVKCPEQESFLEGGLPSSLNVLRISSCHNLKALNGKSLQSLALLEELKIDNCGLLQCLPEEGLPASVSHLYIYRCPLLNERCQIKTGEDWPKISHIAHVEIE